MTEQGQDVRNGNRSVVYDIKGHWDHSLVDGRLYGEGPC